MRVVVLGAGYAGVAVARRLERRLPDGTDLVVVDENDYHLVQHELHRAVRHPSLAADLRIPLDEVLADSTEIRRAHVRDVDLEAGVATLDDGDLDYDFGVVCLGSETDFSGVAGVETHATPLKSLADAERIREEFLDAMPDGRVVVGGAGLSGIQVAGELAELARERGVDADVRLLEQLDRVAPGFQRSFQTAVREELETRGVTVRTNTTVVRVDADAVELGHTSLRERGASERRENDGGRERASESRERLPYDQFVWTGGIRGSSVLGGDRPEVPNTLRLGDRTFAIGDAARVIDAHGEAVPASAQAAVREARVAAANVATLVDHARDGAGGEPRLQRFRFDPLGWVVSVGDGAVATVGPAVLRGTPAKAAKASVDASYLGGLGAVRNAVDLVREQLRRPTGDYRN